MSQDLFYLFSVIGILLAFIASVIAAVISWVSMKTTKQTAKQTNYQNIISVGRAKWQADMREASAKYFTQITRLCEEQEVALNEIYNELTLHHFAIVLFTSKNHAPDEELHDKMSAIRDKALDLVKCNNKISAEYLKAGISFDTKDPKVESNAAVVSARQDMEKLRKSIFDYQNEVFDCIHGLIDDEWEKQKYEAMGMWDKQSKKTGINGNI